MIHMTSRSFPVKVKWVDKYQFIGSDLSAHTVILDTTKEAGGEDLGMSPMRLLLCALGACTGMDIVSILQKQKQQLKSFEVLLKGDKNKDYPQYYTHIDVHYVLRGEGLKESAVRRAIALSREKYCSVEATLSGRAKIESSFEILEA